MYGDTTANAIVQTIMISIIVLRLVEWKAFDAVITLEQKKLRCNYAKGSVLKLILIFFILIVIP